MKTPPIHPLRRWLFERGKTLKEFGDDIGASAGHLSDCLTGKKMPSMQLAAAIAKATRNAVTPNDFSAFYEAVQKKGRTAA